MHSQNNQQIRNKKKFGESEKGSLKMNLHLTPLLMTKKVIYPYDKIKAMSKNAQTMHNCTHLTR